jgi:segregation and condensation protein B
MDQTEIKRVLEAALLAAGRPLTIDKLRELFAAKGGLERAELNEALGALAADYQGRGIELKEVASGYRIQVRSSMSDWLMPLWEERSPRYTRALLETLALVVYRQPITRGEIEEVRGVAVSTNIMRTLLERGWIRVVGHRDVPGKPAMFGTTREFLDYFGLKKLDDLPPLADLKDWSPEESPQTDLAFDPTQAPAQAHAELAEEPEEGVKESEEGEEGANGEEGGRGAKGEAAAGSEDEAIAAGEDSEAGAATTPVPNETTRDDTAAAREGAAQAEEPLDEEETPAPAEEESSSIAAKSSAEEKGSPPALEEAWPPADDAQSPAADDAQSPLAKAHHAHHSVQPPRSRVEVEQPAGDAIQSAVDAVEPPQEADQPAADDAERGFSKAEELATEDVLVPEETPSTESAAPDETVLAAEDGGEDAVEEPWSAEIVRLPRSEPH